jgi:fatty acid synthase subunit alpha
MAQRTRDFKIGNGEISADLELQFWASTKDSKELSYEYEPATLSVHISDIEDASRSTAIDTASSPLVIEQPQAPTKPSSLPLAAASIADVPISAGDIIQALVARKLMKNIEQVSPGKSIKALSGGELG